MEAVAQLIAWGILILMVMGFVALLRGIWRTLSRIGRPQGIRREQPEWESFNIEVLPPIRHRSHYRRKSFFFTRSERSMYKNLREVLPAGHTILSKVRLADLVEIDTEGRSYWQAWGRIAQKHVDFVLCDSQFSPYLVIEVDGKSHELARQRKSDSVKNRVLEDAGLPLLRYKVGTRWDFAKLQAYIPRPERDSEAD